MSFISSETEDLMCCSVCFTDYDDELRKPKFLVQCHHTFCLACLQCIAKGSRLVECPMCRKLSVCPEDGVLALQTNPYPLQMKRMVEERHCCCEGQAPPNSPFLLTDSVLINNNPVGRLFSTNLAVVENWLKDNFVAIEKLQANIKHLRKREKDLKRLQQSLQQGPSQVKKDSPKQTNGRKSKPAASALRAEPYALRPRKLL